MNRAFLALYLSLFVFCGCTTTPHAPQTTFSKAQLGKRITLVGRALDLKLGALLSLDNSAVWIKGVDRWPDGYYLGGDTGKMVKVTGVLGEDHALPVYIEDENIVISGIPMPKGTDLRKASHRYILKKAKWELL